MQKIIQIITTYPIENYQVIKNRYIPFSKVGKEYGFKIILISPDRKKQFHESNLIKHIPLNLDYKKSKNIFIRIYQEVALSLKLLQFSKKNKSEITIISIPSPIILFLAFAFNKKNLVLDARDLSWEYFNNLTIRDITIKFFATLLARINLPFFTSVLVTNESERILLKEKFKLKKNVLLVSNGVSEQQFQKLKNVSNDSHKCKVGYFGNIGIAQNLRNLINVAQKLQDIDFLIVGDGIEKKSLEKICCDKGMKNIYFYGKLDWDDVVKKYEEVNILYAQLNSEFSTAMPSKLYEYLSTGKSIVYAGKGHAAEFLSSFEQCVVLEPNDEIGLEKTFYRINNSKSFFSKSFTNIDIIKKKFIRENQVLKFYDSLK